MGEHDKRLYEMLSGYFIPRNAIVKDVGSQIAVPAGATVTILTVMLEPGAQGLLQSVAYGHDLDKVLSSPAIYLGYDVTFSVLVNNTPLNNDTSPPITKDFNRSLSYNDLRYIVTALPSNGTVSIVVKNNTATPFTAFGRVILWTDPRGQVTLKQVNSFSKETPSKEIKQNYLLGSERSW